MAFRWVMPMPEDSESGTEHSRRISKSDRNVTVYEYEGPGTSSSIVSRVKSHHAEVHDCKYRRLTAKKIASGGRRSRTTVVAVIEGGGV